MTYEDDQEQRLENQVETTANKVASHLRDALDSEESQLRSSARTRLREVVASTLMRIREMLELEYQKAGRKGGKVKVRDCSRIRGYVDLLLGKHRLRFRVKGDTHIEVVGQVHGQEKIAGYSIGYEPSPERVGDCASKFIYDLSRAEGVSLFSFSKEA